jgi:hypothetical protein
MPRRLRIAFPEDSVVPAWHAPFQAWEWREIPGTTFDDYMLDDGTGIVIAHGSPVHNGDGFVYRSMWGDCGPNYSSSNHELYFGPGGGHASTSSNPLIRWNLWKDQPDIEALVQPTTWEIRAAEVDQLEFPVDAEPNATYRQRYNGYFSDGKPYAFHSYSAVNFLDSIDEMVSVISAAGNSEISGNMNWHVGLGYRRGDSAWRPKLYWPNTPDEVSEDGNGGAIMCCFPSYNGDAVYFSRSGGPLRRLDAATRTYSAIGSSTPGVLSTHRRLGAQNSSGKVLTVPTNTAVATTPTVYSAKFWNMTTGAQTTLTSTGYAYPTATALGSYHCRDLKWIDVLDGWVGLYIDGSPQSTGVKSFKWLLFREVSATVVDVTDLTTLMSGTRPSVDSNCRAFISYDRDWNMLIQHDRNALNLKALILTAL